jgi:hypothetical protein
LILRDGCCDLRFASPLVPLCDDCLCCAQP